MPWPATAYITKDSTTSDQPSQPRQATGTASRMAAKGTAMKATSAACSSRPLRSAPIVPLGRSRAVAVSDVMAATLTYASVGSQRCAVLFVPTAGRPAGPPCVGTRPVTVSPAIPGRPMAGRQPLELVIEVRTLAREPWGTPPWFVVLPNRPRRPTGILRHPPDRLAEERSRVSPARPAAVVVLAAGEGTRMKSAIPKVLHAVGGRSLVHHAVTAAAALDPEHLLVVVGHGRDQVKAHLAEVAPSASTAVQDQQRGTGHAVGCALAALPPLDGTVVVTYGDTPLLSGETLRDLVDAHEAGAHAVTVLTAELDDPTGYGRVLRDATGAVTAVIEQKDASEQQRAVREINSGIYAFDAATLSDALSRLTTDNAQGELYLTDVIAIASGDGKRVGAMPLADTWQTEGVNDRVQL